jgi:hypothetical protein
MVLPSWFNSTVRLWLYGILIAAVPLLIVYGIVDKDTAPLWIALGAAVFGHVTAGAALVTQRKTGEVEPAPPKRVRRRKPRT